MTKTITISLSVIFCTLVIIFSSCGEPEEPMELTGISSDFDIVGRWNFQVVSGTGVITGVPQSSTDENPTGFVEFLEGGIGYSDFGIELLNRPYELQDSITWSRPTSDTLILKKISEPNPDVWHIIGANATEINAEWPIEIAGNTATLNAKLTKE